MPEKIYHFTSPAGLAAILRSGCISLSESNLNIREGNCGVVWLTSSPNPANHGLKFDNSIPAQYDKTSIRISLPHKETYKQWHEWGRSKGMDEDYMAALIHSANAGETYTSWYISETEIPIGDILSIEDAATGEAVSVVDALKALPDDEAPKHKFSSVIDEYIANQPAYLQVMLLNVRSAIRQALPDAAEKISWQMPTFWKGRNLIHFAAQKKHLGIYPGAEAMKHFTPRITEYKTSKGAIQFPYNSFGAEQIKLIAEIAAWCGENL
jgi:uncharacterized protein YdhG (YjbR/CyaY superfamily)